MGRSGTGEGEMRQLAGEVKVAQSWPTLRDPMDSLRPHGLYSSPGQNTGMGSLSLL